MEKYVNPLFTGRSIFHTKRIEHSVKKEAKKSFIQVVIRKGVSLARNHRERKNNGIWQMNKLTYDYEIEISL